LNKLVYLDHNATTPMRPQVAEAMSRAFTDVPGNPSSVHAWGRRAREAIERARAQVAAFLTVTPEEVVFTSGGTEGDNLAIRGLWAGAAARGRRQIVTSALEHPAVLGALDALATGPAPATIAMLPVGTRGEIALGDLQGAIGDQTGLVTLALANHELGNRYPVDRFVEVARGRGALFHTDAVQAAGKLPLNLAALGVDAATVSAHKLGGPKGIGAVFIRRGLDLPPLAVGGHQERERRPGTENVPGIVGFGVACALAAEALAAGQAGEARMEELRGMLLAILRDIPGARLLGFADAEAAGARDRAGRELTGGDHPEWREQRVPGTVMVAFPGAPGQLVAIGLDLEGVCVSTGAACSSGSLQPSPVLRALGLDLQQAGEGVRFSLGWTTTPADLAHLGAVLPGIVARVRGAAGRGTS